MAPKYRLMYFDIRGLAEYIRYLFAYLKVEYEDFRLPYGSDEWPKIKPNQPFGKLPVLEVDGEVLAESRAIGRYIAREYGLAGKTNIESAKCDMIASSLGDLNKNRWTWFLEKNEAKKEELKKVLLEQDIPQYFNGLMKILKNNHYFMGNSLTWADIIVANTLYELRSYFPQVFHNYKALSDHTDRVHNLPGIKEWIAKRPVTDF